MITSKVPDDWRQLQTEVGRLLEECGFAVEIEKKVKTVRGEVELDVYAQEEVKGRKYSIVCECKHWKARIPQNVVHGFRTVVADMGANVGYIVSLAGFQGGAFQASELTNVELATWQQLQSKFELSWYESYFSPEITDRLDPILSYAEPFLPAWWGQLSEVQQQQYLQLKEKYDEFAWLVMTFTSYHRMLRNNEPIPRLPVIEQLPPNSPLLTKIPESLLRQATYREFFDEAIAFGTDAINQFQVLRDAALKGSAA
jgi:restriction system protein